MTEFLDDLMKIPGLSLLNFTVQIASWLHHLRFLSDVLMSPLITAISRFFGSSLKYSSEFKLWEPLNLDHEPRK